MTQPVKVKKVSVKVYTMKLFLSLIPWYGLDYNSPVRANRSLENLAGAELQAVNLDFLIAAAGINCPSLARLDST